MSLSCLVQRQILSWEWRDANEELIPEENSSPTVLLTFPRKLQWKVVGSLTRKHCFSSRNNQTKCTWILSVLLCVWDTCPFQLAQWASTGTCASDDADLHKAKPCAHELPLRRKSVWLSPPASGRAAQCHQHQGLLLSPLAIVLNHWTWAQDSAKFGSRNSHLYRV